MRKCHLVRHSCGKPQVLHSDRGQVDCQSLKQPEFPMKLPLFADVERAFCYLFL